MPRFPVVPVVLITGVALRVAVAAQGWLYWDDLVLQAKVRDLGLADALLTPHDGHLMPAGWLVEWALARFAPLSAPAALAVLAALQAGTALAVAWCCRVLTPRPAAPLALYLLSPLTLPATTWLAAGLNSLPVHASLAMVTGHGVRYLRGGSRGHLAAASAWLCGGLLFSERALVIGPAAVAMVTCWGLRERLGRLAAVLALPTAAWAAAYLALVDPAAEAGDRGGLAGLATLVARGYVYALLPAAAGGPWHWQRWVPGPPFAAESALGVLAGAAVVAVVLAWSRRHLVAWVPVLVYPLAPLLTLWWARSGEYTAGEIVMTLRYVSTAAVIAALTLAVLTSRCARPRLCRPIALVVAASCLASSTSYARAWAEQPAREYFANLRGPVLDQAVPLEVLLPVTSPYNRLSRLAPWVVADTVVEPSLVDAHGNRIPAALVTQRTSAEGCGAGELPLDGPLVDYEWTVLLNYAAGSAGSAEVSLDGAPVSVPLEPGLHQAWVRVEGGGDRIRVNADADTCFGRSEVGQLASAP
ncbi:hypothetical protein [Corynebacterium liangguodongii]|uniref:Uncharacterized protein n=1 Tax=Corynebacterium liangguodongii TaxID=2079535 RepID=A0A2S0WBR0_9CORY|nr:hypothetical protein [Corynebacterium liangguodongii]AWB83112.1 hypothetical protein C3E79_00255 [Corynebacterium liangguodongii]PWB99287.1 hypothetical protein DF219_06820 [Corynebacterium liangguodongii]